MPNQPKSRKLSIAVPRGLHTSPLAVGTAQCEVWLLHLNEDAGEGDKIDKSGLEEDGSLTSTLVEVCLPYFQEEYSLYES